MKPVTQIDITKETGQCFSACLASILELPLEAVPNWHDEDWFEKYQRWIRPSNLCMINFNVPDIQDQAGYVRAWFPGYSMIAGESPRYPGVLHSVVCYNGKIVHDPYPKDAPNGDREVGRWKEITVFYILDPKQPVNTDALLYKELEQE